MVRAMTLKQYRDRHKVTLAQLAEWVPCSVAMLAFVEKGERAPSLDMAHKISEATGGKVRISDLPRRAA
jgi:DNA-binding XRE family transcriptional regulator